MRKLTIMIFSILILFGGLIGLGLYLKNDYLFALGVILPLPLLFVAAFLEKKLDSEEKRKKSHANVWKFAESVDTNLRKILTPHFAAGIIIFLIFLYNLISNNLEEVSGKMAGVYTSGFFLLLLSGFLFIFSSKARMDKYLGKSIIAILILEVIMIVSLFLAGERINFSSLGVLIIIAGGYYRWKKLNPETREKGRKSVLIIFLALYALADIALITSVIAFFF